MMKQNFIYAFVVLCLLANGCCNSDKKMNSDRNPSSVDSLKFENWLITDETFVVEDTTLSFFPDDFTVNPKDGIVPDKETAARIAEAIWIPVYGEKDIYEERPYEAHLLNDSVWIVRGSLFDPNNEVRGGTAYIAISKKDGRILQMLHEK